MKRYHETHYRPENALVYVIGDIDPEEAEATLEKIFGRLPARKVPAEIAAAAAAAGGVGADELTLKLQSRHFPPILHKWSGGALGDTAKVPVLKADWRSGEDGGAAAPSAADAAAGGDDLAAQKARLSGALADSRTGEVFSVSALSDAALEGLGGPPGDAARLRAQLDLEAMPPTAIPGAPAGASGVRACVFQHELLQAFSFHLFAKRPVEPVLSLGDYRATVMRRLVLAALQVRFNVGARQEPLFQFIEFNQLDSPREACAVCSLDLTADARSWRKAVATSVREIRRLGKARDRDRDRSTNASSRKINEDVARTDLTSLAVKHRECGSNRPLDDRPRRRSSAWTLARVPLHRMCGVVRPVGLGAQALLARAAHRLGAARGDGRPDRAHGAAAAPDGDRCLRAHVHGARDRAVGDRGRARDHLDR